MYMHRPRHRGDLARRYGATQALWQGTSSARSASPRCAIPGSVEEQHAPEALIVQKANPMGSAAPHLSFNISEDDLVEIRIVLFVQTFSWIVKVQMLDQHYKEV